MTNVIVSGVATPGDGGGDTDVEFTFGTIEPLRFTLQELAKISDTEGKAHRLSVFSLNSDQQFRYHATGFACIQYDVDSTIDRLYFLENVIDGPFMLTLVHGDWLKAFHCETCAQEFAEFFSQRQPQWRKQYHAALRPSAATPKKSYQ